MDKVDEFLEHHGVKGMHWGVKRSGKPGTQEIHDARIRTQARVNQQQVQFDKLNLASTEKGKQAALKEIARIGEEGSSDAEIAGHKTTGEKIGTAILVAGTGALLVSAIAVR